MQTQNNPEIPSGLLWVIFLAKFNPEKPKTTQWVTEFQNMQKTACFLACLQKWDASGLLWVALAKKRKEKRSKKENK